MRRITCAFLILLPFSSCTCPDPDLNVLPEPEAVLVYENQESPPRAQIDIAMGSQLVDSSTVASFRIENRGNRELEVTDIRLATDAELCPSVSPAFRIEGPELDAEGLRSLLIGPQLQDDDPILNEEVSVRFVPTDGSRGCAVVEVHSNDEDENGEPLVLRVLLVGQGDAPQLCTSTPLIDFGEVFIGDSATDTLLLESCGTRPIQLTAMNQNEVFPDPFGVTEPSFPATMQPGETMEVPVSFAPLELRAWTLAGGTAGLLTFSSDTGLAYTISLEGAAKRRPACQLDVAPVAMNFGSVAFGRDSTQTLVVRNLGDLDCNVDSLALRDAGGSFSVTLNDGATVPAVLAPGELLTADVTFAPPVAAGVENNFVDVASDDPAAPLIAVPVEGTSIEPTPCFLEATPTGMNFGNQATGSIIDLELLLTNIGTETCRVSSVELISGEQDFSAISGGFPLLGAIVNAGSSTTALVTFSPTSEGLKVGTIRANYKELGFGNPDLNLDIPVSGNGLDPALCVTPTNLDFGDVSVGATSDQVANISNCGATTVDLRGLQLRAGTHPDFLLPSLPSLPATMAPGDSFQLTVQAAPTAAGIAQGGTAMFGAVEILSNDPDDPAVAVTLRANAPVCLDGLSCQPVEINFGDVAVGGQNVRAISCTNPGSTTVAITPATTAPFSIVNAPPSIAPGTVGIITVRYEPGVAALHTASLTTGATQCDGTPLSVDLMGTGTNAFLPVCPTPETFTPEVVWNWNGGSTMTNSTQIWVTPLMSRLEDTNGDNVITAADTPRVIFVSFDNADSPGLTDTDKFNDPTPGILRAVDGPTGAEIFTVSNEEYRLNSSVTPALADIDGDGLVEIIAQKYVLLEGVETIEGGPKVNGKFVRGNLIAFEHDGTFKWISEPWRRSADEIEDLGAIAVADIDGDGLGEIAVGDYVFDHNGNLLWRGGKGTGSTGHGPTSFFAQMDGQPGLELVTGATVYNNDGTILWNREDLIGFGGLDGHAAVADLDGDGMNELIVRRGDLQILNGATGVTIAGPITPPTDVAMGAECVAGMEEGEQDDCNIIPTNPAIIDVNGDGNLEIAVSSQGVILVYDQGLNELWRSQVWDGTGASGPIGFDFEADGMTNVIYSDEGSVFVYDPSGATLYDADRQSVTMFETVSVGDVTLDGHANIAVGSNEPTLGLAEGLDLLTNAGTSWAHARGMWNQHAYVESLISEMGTLIYDPAAPGLDGFRTATPACVP